METVYEKGKGNKADHVRCRGHGEEVGLSYAAGGSGERYNHFRKLFGCFLKSETYT